MYILSNVSKEKLNFLRESVKDKSQKGSIKWSKKMEKCSIYISATTGYLWCGWYSEKIISKENLKDVQSR